MDVGVFALIQNPEGKILLVKDVTRQQLWTLPGGGPDLGELMPDTLVREIFEETSLEVSASELLGVFSQKKTPGIVLLFRANIISGEAKADGVETADCNYFSRDEMLEMRDDIKPAQLSMVCQVLDSNKYPLFNHFVAPE